MKRKSEREYPILWEAVKVAFDKRRNLDKWFTPKWCSEKSGNKIFLGDLEKDSKSKKQKVSQKNKAPKLKTRSVGLRPSKEQKQKLDLLMKGSTYAYNFALRLMNEHTSDFVETEIGETSILKLQGVVSCQNPKKKGNEHKLKYFEGVPEWFLKIPSLVKQHALKRFVTAYNTAKTRGGTLREKDLSVRDGGIFGVSKPKKKEGQKEEDRIPGKYLNIFARTIGHIQMKSKFSQPINHDFSIYKNAVGKYYALFPIPIIQRDMREDAKGKMVGIDPGVRTFATVYDPSRCEATQYGTKSDCQYQSANKSRKKEKERYKKSVEGITNKLNGVTEKRRALLNSCDCRSREELEDKVQKGLCGKRRLRKYDFYSKLIAIANYRLKNKVKDIHRTLARKLVDENELIVIGELKVSNFNKQNHGNNKLQRHIRSKMRMWSHYKFREYLKFKALEVKGCKVEVQNEAYTSQTCGMCENRKKDLRGNKRYLCDKCSYETDRDVNGARNILRFYLRNS